ncbi:MAG: type 3 dihydrofolate reductase [Wenzhouxiangella sp.]|nr:type 3 dihydrofolate reductase [Wenzhouxiangella sp.]MCH8477222.1 type 3 dihydrofolate reductase [Wenzhouxiangella sp.]TVR95264.1 MAG: type 3 dihydrofolate reductase [Wenzhouxiangellaceae bacterium]
MPELTLVAAMARGRVIGAAGGMPWHLPADLAHFKRVTLGHPVVMGRKTFESIGRPLPGRRNIVLSRSASGLPAGLEQFSNLEQALAALEESSSLMVIGGGEIYRLTLPQATRLVLTFIDAGFDGDTYFPEFSLKDWRLSQMEARPADDSNVHDLIFAEFERR